MSIFFPSVTKAILNFRKIVLFYVNFEKLINYFQLNNKMFCKISISIL